MLWACGALETFSRLQMHSSIRTPRIETAFEVVTSLPEFSGWMRRIDAEALNVGFRSYIKRRKL